MKTINADDLHAKDLADPAYREAYESLESEFELINALLRARAHAGISQAEVASRMGTTESTISRLESGRTKPSTRTLERYAEATGHRLQISLEPTGGVGEAKRNCFYPIRSCWAVGSHLCFAFGNPFLDQFIVELSH